MESAFAPIILFVYNRPEHTLRTLKSLQQNELADDSMLFIYSDGAKAAKDIKAVERVRAVIRKEKWCKNIFIIESVENKGLCVSIKTGLTEVINRYGRAIILEDDILTHKYFLRFMNKGLDKYKDYSSIFSVAGYLEPIDLILDKPFFLSKGTSWGWATWADKWNNINWSIEELIYKFENDSFLMKKLNFSNYPYFDMLLAQQNQELDTWDIQVYANSILNNQYHLHPPVSLTQNIGFDGSGTHCNDSDTFLGFKGDFKRIDNIDLDGLQIEEAIKVEKAIEKTREKYFPTTILARIKRKLNNLIR